jgi:hypothetical protein
MKLGKIVMRKILAQMMKREIKMKRMRRTQNLLRL